MICKVCNRPIAERGNYCPICGSNLLYVSNPVSANDIANAIQEFEDNAYHPSLKPDVSSQAKALAIVALQEKLLRVVGADSQKE